MKSIRMNHLAVGNGERVLRYTGRVNYGDVVNVGTVGHIDWGRHGYHPDLEARSVYDVYLSQEEINELWGAYVRVTATPQNGYVQVEQSVSSDYAIVKRALAMSKKRGQPYLGFDNGGLVVAGKVIWILADKEYRRFHKKAAEWVLPAKDYIAAVVARYLWRQEHAALEIGIPTGWGASMRRPYVPDYTGDAYEEAVAQGYKGNRAEWFGISE